jgi:aryl-alcohol dehydrogenase-like predicted oxidoreductase
MPKNSRMDLFYDFWPRYRTVNSEKAIEEYWNLAKNFKLNLAQMAIKFCEIRPFVTSVIIGATTLEQLKTNIDSVDINLNKELIEKIGEIQKKYPNPCP